MKVKKLSGGVGTLNKAAQLINSEEKSLVFVEFRGGEVPWFYFIFSLTQTDWISALERSGKWSQAIMSGADFESVGAFHHTSASDKAQTVEDFGLMINEEIELDGVE